jgi:hypothetical protein
MDFTTACDVYSLLSSFMFLAFVGILFNPQERWGALQ